MQRIALLESEKHVDRAAGGSAASIALHVVVLAFAIAVTSHAGSGTKSRDAVYVALPPWRPQVTMISHPVTHHAANSPPRSQTTISVAVPSVIPDPGISPDVPTAIGPAASAVPGAQPGTDTAVAATRGDSPFGVEEVDVPASVLSGQRGPIYPEGLRAMGIEGRVVARFVIGKTGRVEADPTIVSSSDDEFAAAVRRYLTTARYRPATKNGEPVRQLAEQEFDFTVRR
jgi:protein TonB